MAHFWNIDAAGCWVATPVGDTPAVIDDSVQFVKSDDIAARARETRARAAPCQSDGDMGARVPAAFRRARQRRVRAARADDPLRPRRTPHPRSTRALLLYRNPRTCRNLSESAAGFCPRCKLPLTSGSAAVRCPGSAACGITLPTTCRAGPTRAPAPAVSTTPRWTRASRGRPRICSHGAYCDRWSGEHRIPRCRHTWHACAA